VNKELAKLLRKKGTFECTRKSEDLENEIFELSSINLRSLGLDEKNIEAVTNVIEKDWDSVNIKSISFSYNQQIGDVGASLLARKLPHSIAEIGLVKCGIGDKGGREILNWMRKTPMLQMICIEQNNFSDNLKMEFGIFENDNPKTIVVY
jgi:hypothetical protein